MEPLRLQRTGDAPLVFNGNRLARAESPRGPRDKRGFVVDVYQRNGAGSPQYVAHVQYDTRWTGELTAAWCVTADNLRGLALALSTFANGLDLDALMLALPEGERFRDKRIELGRILRAGLKTAVSDALNRTPGAEERV